MSELSREQIEYWRKHLTALSNLTESAQLNMLCDMALRSESGRAGVIEECARVCRKLHINGIMVINPVDQGNRPAFAVDCEKAIRALKSAPNEMAEMPEPHVDGKWCKNLRCAKCYGADTWQQSKLAMLESDFQEAMAEISNLRRDADKLRREVEELREDNTMLRNGHIYAIQRAESYERRLSDAGGTVRVPREPTKGAAELSREQIEGWKTHFKSQAQTGDITVEHWHELRALCDIALRGERGDGLIAEIDALDNAERCNQPMCNDSGCYATQARDGSPEPNQCEFCYTNPRSLFNAKLNLRKTLRPLSGEQAVRVPTEPTVDECFAAGQGPAVTDKFREGGLPNTAEERARFEAYMRGHCWDFGNYDSERQCYDTVSVRMLYGVWRDRGLLSAALSGGQS